MRTFINSLPGHLEGVDFRVLAPPGGYREFVNDVLLEYVDYLDILAAHLGREETVFVLLRVYVNRFEIAMSEPIVRFEHSQTRLLTGEGEETDVYVTSDLTVDLDVVRDQGTAGSLRMWRPTTIESLLA